MRFFSVRIVARTHDALLSLDRFDLDLKKRAASQEGSDRFVVPGILSEEQIEQVKSAGYTVEVVSDLTEVARERITEVSRVNRYAEIRGVADFGERAILGYMTVDEVESALTNLHTLHPDLITLIALPHQTWENRISHAVRLKAEAKPNRPGVLFTGSMHAREWGGSDICINFLVSLINAYRSQTALALGGKTFTATQVKAILENVDIFVFPDVNPDGKNFSQTHDPSSGGYQTVWWRKNRNPNTAVDPSNRGVDLNRNFDFLWSSGIGTSAAASSNVYKGQAAFSEPETRNVRFLFDSYDNISYFVDIHSYSELILYSWGDDNNQNTEPGQNFQNAAHDGKRGIVNDSLYREFISTLDENTLKNFAERMNNELAAVRGKHYAVKQSVGLYPTSATSDDYVLARNIVSGLKNRIYGFTIEFGSEFVPPFAEMSKVIQDVCSAMTELCWAVSSDIYIRDNAADTGAVPTGVPFWDSPDIWVRNIEDGGTSHQNTIRGKNNFIYVRVTNRGQAEAQDLKVRVYITSFAGTEFIHPLDWVPKNPTGGGTLAGTGTYFIGEVQVASLPPAAATVVHVKWAASLIPPETNWHPCLLVEVSPNDGLSLKGRHVWENNNLAQKNITIVNAKVGKFIEFPFLFGSPHSKAQAGEIVVKRASLSKKAEILLDIDDDVLMQQMTATITALPQKNQIISGFKIVKIDERLMFSLTGQRLGRIRLPLKPQKPKRMVLRAKVPEASTSGERHEIHVLQYEQRKKVVGGLTLQIILR
jgi:murein tripeptide amidase MpaA